MDITRDTVLQLAELVKIELAPAEADALGADLNAILGYVRLLDEVDTRNVEPMVSAFGGGVFRQDAPGPGLHREDLELLSGFDAVSGYFAVPAVFGDGDV